MSDFLDDIVEAAPAASRQYSPEEKAAYWKAKAQTRRAPARRRRAPRRRSYSTRTTRYTRGYGDYSIPRNFFSAKKLGGMLGGAGGAALGNMLAPGIGAEAGGALGASAGSYLGRLFKKITGWGDYQVKENSLVHENSVVPSFGEDSIRVRKREYVGSINSDSTVFNNTSFPINPGLATSFPWLSEIAANYEQYRVNGMIFQFISTSSDAIASVDTKLGLGQVILATNYDAGADSFQDSPQMLNFTFSNSGKPSENILHAIECAPTDTAQKLYYTRSGDVPPDRDPRLYDLGVFQIATDNMPAVYTGMGQLWVSYDITFCKSQANNALGFGVLNDFYHFTTGINNSNPFGTDVNPATPVDGSILGTYIDQNTIYFPATLNSGYYLIQIAWRGTATALTGPTFTGVNCKGVDCFVSSECRLQAPPNSVSSARMAVSTIVKLNTLDTSEQSQVGLGGLVLPTSATDCWLIVTQLNGDIYDSFGLSGTNQWP